MATSIQDALKNVKEIYMSDSALASLLDFERVIDELDVYAFENWKLGELVEGPVYEKYFVTCTFMWPHKKMPDPRGGEQLLNYNCEVLYKKSTLEYPVKPKSPDDFKPNTKMAKKKSVPIWLVTLTIPKKLMDDIQQGSIELENEKLDLEDLEQAYEEGVDDDAAENNGDDQQQGPDMDGSMGGMGAMGGQVPQMPQQQAPGGMM
jgi:hypothetical protein